MKKLLGISLIAALAVSPMMANAAYEQGSAYLGAVVSGDQPTGEQANPTTTTDAPGFVLATGKTNDDALATGTYVKGAYNAAIKAVNAEYTRAKGIEEGLSGNIGTLSSLTTGAQGSLVAAINEVDSHADDNATNIGTMNSLQVQVSDGNGGSERAADLVSAINAVNSAVSDLNTSMTEDFATKDGVDSTINATLAATTASTTGTVTALSSWDSNNTVNVPIAATTILAPATAAYPAVEVEEP